MITFWLLTQENVPSGTPFIGPDWIRQYSKTTGKPSTKVHLKHSDRLAVPPRRVDALRPVVSGGYKVSRYALTACGMVFNNARAVEMPETLLGNTAVCEGCAGFYTCVVEDSAV